MWSEFYIIPGRINGRNCRAIKWLVIDCALSVLLYLQYLILNNGIAVQALWMRQNAQEPSKY